MVPVEKIVCIYHGGCVDGFTAAWCVYRTLALNYTVRFVAGDYQEPPPIVEYDELVLMVDFGYRRDVMLELAKCCAGIVIIDHHATAILDLKQDLDRIIDWAAWDYKSAHEQINEDVMINDGGRIYTIFDNERSGAGLAWDMLHVSDFERSFMVSRVEDRDLWRFRLPGSREVHAVLQSYDPTFPLWEELNARYQVLESRDLLIHEGEAIIRAHQRQLDELLPLVTRPMQFQTPNGVFTVPVANLPHIYASEGGHMMLDGRDICGRLGGHTKHTGITKHAFAATYYDSLLYRVFSLRSKSGGQHVGEIAAKYGGGGHAHSAGFKLPRSDDPDDYVNVVYSTWPLMQ